MKKNSIEQKGQSLIEILLAIGLSAILLPALLTGLVSSRQGKAQESQRTQALYLLNETIDSIRSIREKSWSSFAVNGTFHPVVSGSSWTMASGSAVINGFTQQVVISDVNRNPSGEIALVGGTPDPSSKKVDTSISWGQPYVSSVNSSLYITRYLENNSFIQTSAADFDTGSKSGTTVTNTSGGEVILGAGGQGDWCNPNLSIAALNLPKSGVVNTLSAIEGKAFAGTGDNSSGVSFANVLISDTNPPVASVAGTFDGYKTNGVFGEENYAYLATDNHSEEVVIIDTNNLVGGKYQKLGWFDMPGNISAKSVYVANDIGYVVTSDANILYSFDLRPASGGRTGSRPLLGNLVLDSVYTNARGTQVVVKGSYAYVSIYAANDEMKIIDISDPTNMTQVGFANVSGQEGMGVFINPTATRAYLIANESPILPEFFVIDITQKTGYRGIEGMSDTNGMDPKGITVVTGNKAIIVGTGGEEYQVLDISNESAPVRCGGLNIDSGIKGVSSILETDGDAYSYIASGDSTAEFKIIEGGPGGQYATLGDFTSSTFDAGFKTAFNRFDVSVNRLNSTDIQFQVAVSQDVGGSCSGSSFDFVGPDGTVSTFFTTNVTLGTQVFGYPIPFGINPGRCFKYKTYLSTLDPLSTPIFYDITVNYSP